MGRFLECRKWNILVISRALGIFLIYMPAASGLWPLGLGIYIRQIPRAHVITITYITNVLQGHVGFRFSVLLSICNKILLQLIICLRLSAIFILQAKAKGLHERALTNQQFDGSKSMCEDLVHRYWRLL